MTQIRKITTLALLFSLWVGIFVYQFTHQPEQKRQPLKYKKGDVSPVAAVRSSPESVIRLDLLKSAPQKLIITKNIFEPIHVYVPPPPKPKTVLPPLPPPVVLPPPPSPEEIARQQAEQARQLAIKSLSEFKYLGYLNKGKSREQGFFSKGGELFIVGKGEVLSGSFILKELDPNHAVLRDKTTGAESTLLLSQSQ